MSICDMRERYQKQQSCRGLSRHSNSLWGFGLLLLIYHSITGSVLAGDDQIQRLEPWRPTADTQEFEVLHSSDYMNSRPPRVVQRINADWTFHYVPTEVLDTRPAQPAYDDSQWQAVALPHTWNTYETTREVHPFNHSPAETDDPYWWNGWGWYRKRFTINELHAAKRVFLEFDSVQKYCRVWVNGREVGDHKGGYNSFYFDITDHIRFGQETILVVAVSNRRNDAYRIPPMTAGNWNVYGGIYRDVRLVIKNPVHIPFQGSYRHEGGTFVTTPEVSMERAVVRVRTWVRNDTPDPQECILHTTVLDPNGRVVLTLSQEQTVLNGRVIEFDQTSDSIENPKLWSPDKPVVYTVRSELKTGDRVVDVFLSPLGFRWFAWDYKSNRLVLNGEKIHIHGTNRHQEYPWLGDAMPKWMHIRDMQDMRFGLGHNFLRTAHYSQDPLVYDLSDRFGVIVCEEVPNIKSIDFDEDVQQQQVIEMIRRDRNHPSILFWSMGNETTDGADSQWAIQEDKSRLIHARKVHNDSAGTFVNHTDENMDMENLLRVTVRGWYDTQVKSLEPEDGQHCGPEEWQHTMARRQNGSVRGRLDMHNGVMWLYADHGADREYLYCPLKHINPKGWVDMYRIPKYIYYLWQANYTESPMVFIHPHRWQSARLGQSVDIQIDSNCQEVELFIDDRSLGVRRPHRDSFNTITFAGVTVQQGTLRAVGRATNRVVAQHVPLAGRAAAIVLTTSHESLTADRSGVAVVTAQVVDERGTPVSGFTETLQWTVSGPGRLVGASLYTTDIHKNGEMEGTMYIVAPTSNLIRSTSHSGTITVAVSSSGLESGHINIMAINPPRAQVAGITTPSLSDQGRAIHQIKSYTRHSHVDYPKELNNINGNHFISSKSAQAYIDSIALFIQTRNPEADPNSTAFKTLTHNLGTYLQQMDGQLIADDYNFKIRQFNDCRIINQYVSETNLPKKIKQQLKHYYAREIIAQGVLKDVEAEKKLVAAQVRALRAEDELFVYGLSSSPPRGDNVAVHVLDGDENTAWIPGGVYIHGGKGEWIKFDLGTLKMVDMLKIISVDAPKRPLITITVSEDGTTWREVESAQEESHRPGLWSYDFADAEIRYVKISLQRDRNHESVFASFAEIVICGRVPQTNRNDKR